MRFFPVLLPELAMTKSICLMSSQGEPRILERKKCISSAVLQTTSLERVFHLLRHLALGTAGNISQTNGISMETSISAGRKQTLTTKSSAVSAKGRRKMNIWLSEKCFIPVPTRIGFSIPIQKKNEVVVMIFGFYLLKGFNGKKRNKEERENKILEWFRLEKPLRSPSPTNPALPR